MAKANSALNYLNNYKPPKKEHLETDILLSPDK
jgi:hypothetical protein